MRLIAHIKKRIVSHGAALFALTVLVALATARPATGARVELHWKHPGNATYELYIGQQVGAGPEIFVQRVHADDASSGRSYRWALGGVDPRRPAFFFLLAINSRGQLSRPSDIREVTPDDFCAAFDLDGDRQVSASDILAILRRVVGLDGSTGTTVSDAYEILLVAEELGCDARLGVTEARAE